MEEEDMAYCHWTSPRDVQFTCCGECGRASEHGHSIVLSSSCLAA